VTKAAAQPPVLGPYPRTTGVGATSEHHWHWAASRASRWRPGAWPAGMGLGAGRGRRDYGRGGGTGTVVGDMVYLFIFYYLSGLTSET
jgi:hypothetical protein